MIAAHTAGPTFAVVRPVPVTTRSADSSPMPVAVDPAAVPLHVWEGLTMRAKGWTAYTHQFKSNPDALAYAMASVESLDAARFVWAQDGRTFRLVRSVSEIDPKREVLCPASAEGGKRTTCADCMLCSGLATKSPKSVAIVAHGMGKAYI